MLPIIGEFPAMNNLNSLLNQQQVSLLQEIHNNFQSHPSSSSSNDDFFQQMLSSITSPASAFPWADHQTPPLLCEQSAAKMRQHQISNGAAKAIVLQQQLLLAVANDLRSPVEPDAGFFPVPHGDHNDVVDGPSFNPAILVGISKLLDIHVI
ncbi:hypothetical protein C2S51_010750 [Perilla frutescens var. frutescens]|nr:hypothetical protein C2S51_010750 [Perilla frutescens var. frutescens]